MIPKTLHYFGYNTGKRPPSYLNRRCFDSWKRVLPSDWKMIDWSEPHLAARVPSDFFQEGVRTGTSACLATCSEFIRYWTLYEFGGVYLDCDVELIQEPDLNHECFFGFQRRDTEKDCINSSAIGSVKGHPFLKRLVDSFNGRKNYKCGVYFCVMLPTQLLYEAGMKGLDIEQKVGDVTVYATDRFYPWSWEERPQWKRISDRTYGIHWWEGNWIDETYR